MEHCLLVLVAVAIVTSYTYVNAQSTLPVHEDETRCQEEYQTHLVTIPLLERIVTSLNGLHQRMELAEEENRKTRIAVTEMKSKQDADSQRLLSMENENRIAYGKLHEIAKSHQDRAGEAMIDPSQNASNVIDSQVEQTLNNITTTVTEMKESQDKFYKTMNDIFGDIHSAIISTSSVDIEEKNLNKTLHNIWSTINSLMKGTEMSAHGIIAEMKQFRKSNEAVRNNVTNMVTAFAPLSNSIQRSSSEIKEDLSELQAAIEEHQTIAQNSAARSNEILKMLQVAATKQTAISNLLQNTSSTERIFAQNILTELKQLHTSDESLIDKSDAAHRLQEIIRGIISRMDERSSNTSTWQLSQTLRRVYTQMSEYHDGMGSLSGKIQHLIDKGNMQLEALGTLTEKMTHIKEHVKSAHDNVTALIQNLSDQTRNVSGLITPAPTSNLGSRSSPAQSCASLTGKPSGLYWIKPDGGGSSNTIQVYCDMETEGGGWTLVYSYRFLNYGSFRSSNNAVTPRPTWRVTWPSRNAVPSSTTPPRSETDYGAVSFSLWQEIGSEFLVKSNIANWIKCSEDGGSMVRGRAGSLDCEIVKQIYMSCPAAVPNALSWDAVGPYLRHRGGQIYFWDGSKTSIYPTHDPCGGTSSSSRFPTISNPHGNIYLR